MSEKLKFSQYADFLAPLIVRKNILHDFEVCSVTSNSADADKNSLFCAVKGVKNDGNNYVADVLQRGAGGIISTREYKDVNSIQVADDRMAYSEAERFFYGEPDKKIALLGVTGTNGKTTSVYLFFALLRALGRKPAIFSTIQNFDGKNYFDSQCTTPDAGVLFDLCRRAVDNGAEYLLLECSSHALSQSRLGQSRFQTAIFTNLTGDHLDYHKDMESYFKAKKILFFNNLAENGCAVINIDDEYGARLALELKNAGKNVKTFGFVPDADLHMEIRGDVFYLNDVLLECSLFGKHNFYNICGVLGALSSLGFELEKCLEILRNENISVPGRLEKIDVKQHGTAFVDYAHTDDALRNVLQILRSEAEKKQGRVICVFGCGGDRDRSKRPRMGRAVSELADEFIITSDNPRHEKSEDIAAEILSGCIKSPFAVELDRRAAIRMALDSANENDFILIAGKGHEKEQQVGDKKIYFDDCAEVRMFLENIK